MDVSEQIYTDLKAELPAIKEALLTGVDYASDVGTRFIQYDVAIHTFSLIVGLAFFVFFVKKARSINGWIAKAQREDEWYSWWMCYIWNIVFLVLLVGVFLDLEIIAKAIFIPEIRMLEVLSKLIK